MSKQIALYCVLALLTFGASAPVSAQELQDRELRPLFELPKEQQPVEIVSIWLKNQPVKPGEKIKGDDDWLQGVSFRVKNVSDKPISYVGIILQFTSAQRVLGYSLNYGVDISRGELRRNGSPAEIQPGSSVDLILSKDKYPRFKEMLGMAQIPRSFDVVAYYIERVSFEDNAEVIWEGGYLKRRDPTNANKFYILGRYALPPRPAAHL